MGTSDGGEAGPGAPQPNRIEVHVHQESGLAKLLLSGCSLLQPLVLQPRTASQTLGSSRLLVASWVVQIVLGVLSGVLGGFLYISRSTTLRESGAPIWTGAVVSGAGRGQADGPPVGGERPPPWTHQKAVLAGVVAFVYEKRGGIYWALLRTALALTAFSTATAAIVIAAANFNQYHYSFYDNICDVSPPWGPTWPPGTPNPDVSRQQLCILYLDKLKAMFTGLQVILLGVWVLLLLASLVPLCLCCWRRYQQKELTHPAFALRRETFSWKILPRVVKSSPTPPEDSDLELHLDGSHLCLLGENSGQREAPPPSPTYPSPTAWPPPRSTSRLSCSCPFPAQLHRPACFVSPPEQC